MTSDVTGSHEPELSMPTHQNSVLPTEVSAPQPVADIYNGRGEEYRAPGGPPRQIRKKAPEKPDEIPQKPRVELDDFGLPIRKARPSPDSNSQPAIATTGKSTGSTDNLPLRSKTEDSLARQNLTRSVSAPVRDIDRSKKNPEPDTIINTDQQTKEIADRTLKKSAVDTSEQSQPNQEPSEIEKLGGQSDTLAAAPAVSEWSHQRLTTKDESTDSEDDERWQAMPALGSFDVYDDYGGAGKGYTTVHIDEDAQSGTSLDEETKYLFPESQTDALCIEYDIRDPMSQLQATKTLLTEGQRIAYVGVTRLIIFQMVKDLEGIQSTKSARKYLADAADATAKWGQQMMIRLYGHMEIDAAEQVMIEQLAEHGVQPVDLVPPLMQNSRVKNPAADCSAAKDASDSASSKADRPASSVSGTSETPSTSTSPPPYSEHQNDDLPEVRTPSQLPSSKKLDIDLRWTVLCDLFLVLIADSTYDARSRRLLERVAETMDISWMQICRFEKRVVDALEMQEERNKETWDEAEHMEKRRKEALKRRYMIMGLATVGGGLVIGLHERRNHACGGLAPVEGIPGIENFDATKFVNGHMAYRAAMPRLLREVGWEVESDEFTEIEDPDPDSHQERQRELIREIQEARKQAEEKPDKKKFGFFKRGKLAEKKGWETYDVDQGDRSPTNSCDGNADPGGTVLFDIDAIRAELASEQIQVKQLESTLPPMKLHLNPPSPVASPSFHGQKKAPPLSTELEEAAIETHTASDSPSEPADARLQDFKPLPDLPSDGNPFNESWRQEEIQMTFDTAYHQTPSTTSPSLAESGNHELGPVSSNLTPLHSVTQSPTETHNDPPRLAHFDKSGLNHNAWATDDDDSSIKLSFA
ncbi:DUF726 family protein [Coccidioides immitis H538.4]|uniref:DUF726 family protein n=1 Tax=Coccidioides immitis H538.4 TaxID=396776 RepID=A0A0J8RME5_COCIT|nr:DUF726 family protein [Coccidioides immitis H538.4]